MRNPSSTGIKKTTTPCCSKVGIKRGPWTPEEDELLANYINKEGEGRWRMLPKRAGLLRCGKSCRLRWMNYLRPSVKRGRIAPDEEDLILRLHRLLGNRWSLIAGRIPGRTDNEIKNYWNTHLSKKLISQGIDPRTHKPLKPNPNPSQLNFHDAKNQTSKPNSYQMEDNNGSIVRVVATKVSGNFSMTNLLDQYQNPSVDDATKNVWPNSDGFFMGSHSGHGQSNEEVYNNTGNNGNEDPFSSFLDSLMVENVFTNQLQQLPSMIASTQMFNPSSMWEAEMMSSMAALGDEGGVFK